MISPRVTYCTAHPSYPRVFCWIYRFFPTSSSYDSCQDHHSPSSSLNFNLTLSLRHEGRKMKQELRCHAVLCPKEEKARQMATCLQERLHQVRSSTNLDSDSDSPS